MARLQAGERACQAKKWVEAIDQLRIACFGLLDQPLYLSEGLAVLALAQNGAGKTAAVDTTLGRFLEVEQRFAVWAKVPLQRDVRADFETLLTKRVRPEVLLTVPTLSGLVETEEQRIAKLPPKERLKALEAKAAAEPRNLVWPLELARAATERGDQKATIRWADKVLEIDDRQVEALKLRARAREARGDHAGAQADLKMLPAEPPAAPTPEARPAPSESPEKQLAEAREMLKGGKPAEAKVLLVPLAKADPTSREVQKLLLEAALLTRDWKVCAAQAAALDPFADGEEPYMFYAAVGLYETGNLGGARTLLARARPGIASAPFVDYYAKKILGQ
ncbi:MAG TPA: hypothetical protein VL084_06335 [Thermoanaerobaculia bacterium]|nr:hypothetical protein [Thermoanaerobaculia bacterium]